MLDCKQTNVIHTFEYCLLHLLLNLDKGLKGMQQELGGAVDI